MQFRKTSRLSLLTAGEWFLVLPATVFLAAAALRLLQPPQYEPARTSMAIFDWTTAHVSHLGAALLFFGLPGIVAIAGCVSLWMVWRGSEELREDVRHAFRILGRNLVTGLLAAATLVAGVIVLFESVHVLTD